MNPTFKEDDANPDDDIESKAGGKKKRRNENKICWSCSVDPDKVVLLRCNGGQQFFGTQNFWGIKRFGGSRGVRHT